MPAEGRRFRTGPVHLLPRFVWDLRVRGLVALGAGVLLILPLVAVPGAGSRAGPSAGAAGPALAAAVEAPLSLSMALAAVFLAAGCVSEPVRRGWCRTALVRPGWRPGWFLARFAAAVAWVPALGVGLHAVLDLLTGPGRLPLAAAATVPGALAWAATAGAPTFAFSCLLRRGDGLAATALLLLPALLASLGDPEGRPLLRTLAAVAPPVGPARRALEAGLAGLAPEPGHLLAVAGHASAWILVGLVALATRRLAAA